MTAKTLFLVLLLCAFSAAQTSAPTMAPSTPAPSTVLLLAQQIDQIGQTSATDISRVRIDKWKTDGDQKQIAQGNADSLQRNLSSALPTLTAAVKAAPQDIAAAFRLYRNLNALYDVMKAFTESTGAFGKKEEYEVLSQDLGTMDGYRRSLADYLEQLAAYKDAQSRQVVAGTSASQNKTGVKKIIVDDAAPAPKKKASTKKK
jgi:hypothetical protein